MISLAAVTGVALPASGCSGVPSPGGSKGLAPRIAVSRHAHKCSLQAETAARGNARLPAHLRHSPSRSATAEIRRFAPFDYWRRMLRIGSRCCVGNLSTGCSWRSAPHKSRSGISICSGACINRIGKQKSSCARRRGVALPLQREPEGPDEGFSARSKARRRNT